jgi:gluconokinase
MAGGGHCFLGVDLGTTNAKAVAYTTDGTAVATADRRVALTAEQGRAEQDPDAVLAAAADAVAEVSAVLGRSGHGVVAAGFSGALHSLLALDGGGRPLTPALTWADGRAAAQAAQLADDAGELAWRTGTPVHPMAPLAKLRWFAQERPDVAARARRWLSLKEYVLLQLTGEALVDHSVASATGLFDLENRAWDGDALDLAGVTREQLSAPVPMATRL